MDHASIWVRLCDGESAAFEPALVPAPTSPLALALVDAEALRRESAERARPTKTTCPGCLGVVAIARMDRHFEACGPFLTGAWKPKRWKGRAGD